MSTALFERLRESAVEIHVSDHLEQRLQKGERLRVKLGLDPTAPDIHVGHLIPLDVLRAFQDEGHTVVAIIGDFTALIGDPSGRSETRPVLSREQVDANAATYFEQVFKVLDRDRTEIHGNAEWLGRMGAADVLRLLGTRTLQSVLQREDFATRLAAGTPIGAHEILYPFNQAYDSVAIRADVEIGGTDQLFNLLFGREIQRAYGQPAQDVAVFQLLEGLDGKQKMSKSLGNYIGIAELGPEIYGKTMSIPDSLTERYLRLVSGLGQSDVETALALGPRDAKAALARALVQRLHGAEAAAQAEADFDAKFRHRDAGAAALPEVTVPAGSTVAGALVAAGLYPSVSQVRKLVGRSLTLDGNGVEFDHPVRDGEMLKAGKRHFLRIRVS
ncbi:MAG: tyrosine--tRNA ligase [Candidatus Dormibacteraeota bacterium]|nr:tyrosine--tRNA ligase [Candidatus Dormibacteraeota bacterium]